MMHILIAFIITLNLSCTTPHSPIKQDFTDEDDYEMSLGDKQIKQILEATF